MAAGKAKGQTGATPPARVYDPSAVSVVEPPAQARPRESSIPPAVLSAMADALAKGWATNGATYDSKDEAQRDAGKFKRALAPMAGDSVKSEKDLRSRTWQGEGDKFVFAIGIREAKDS